MKKTDHQYDIFKNIANQHHLSSNKNVWLQIFKQIEQYITNRILLSQQISSSDISTPYRINFKLEFSQIVFTLDNAGTSLDLYIGFLDILYIGLVLLDIWILYFYSITLQKLYR